MLYWLESKFNLTSIKEQRSRKLFTNILNSAIIKVLSVISSFYLIGCTIKSIDTHNYGIWLALTSIISWINIFDIGLSNGLRNKLAEAFAKNDLANAKKLISTTYVLMLVIVLPISIISLLFLKYVNWQNLLNSTVELYTLKKIVLIVVCSFSLQLILKPISSVLLADQKNFSITLIQLVSNLLAIVFIFFISYLHNNSLLIITAVLGFAPVIVSAFYTVFFFTNKYKNIAPSIKCIDFSYKNTLLNLGIGFFIIQLSGIIIYSLTNFVISHYFGPDQVTQYNIAFKYFSIIAILHGLYITPFWSAFTDAYILNDFTWIKKMINNIMHAGIVLAVIGICMLFLAPIAYNIWIGKAVQVTFSLNMLIALSFIISLFSGSFIMFINGTGKIRLQVIYASAAAILHFPILMLLIYVFKTGINSFIVMNIIWSSIALLLFYNQYKIIIKKKKVHKLWNQ